MNIFYLDHDYYKCAQYHVDRHVVKMILEYAQLLSTAHRVLDGEETIEVQNNRKIKRYKLSNSDLDSVLYKATHRNHPSAVWVRESIMNYAWLYNLLRVLCEEYTYRYGKKHLVEIKLIDILNQIPDNMKKLEFTEPTPAMPVEYIIPGDSLKSYRNYYKFGKSNLHNWKLRGSPDWIKNV